MPSPTPADLTLVSQPTEIFQHIGGYLSVETLLMFRLTCKTLEAASLTQFAAIPALCHLHCWILGDQRWRRVLDILNSRLALQVRSVVVAKSPVGHAVAEKDFPVVIEKPRKILNIPESNRPSRLRETESEQRILLGFIINEAHRRQPTNLSKSRGPVHKSVMDQALRQIRSHRIPLILDWIRHRHEMPDDTHGQFAALLGTIACAKASINQVSITQLDCTRLGSVFGQHENELLQATSTIKNITLSFYPCYMLEDGFCEGKRAGRGLDQAVKLIGSASHLQELHLHFIFFGRNPEQDAAAHFTATKVLLANSLTGLRVLSLTKMDLESDDLLKGLTRCQSTLTSLTLSAVSLFGSNDAWSRVWRCLFAMDKLEILFYRSVTSFYPKAKARLAKSSNQQLPDPYVSVQGREAVKAELERLVSLSR